MLDPFVFVLEEMLVGEPERGSRGVGPEGGGLEGRGGTVRGVLILMFPLVRVSGWIELCSVLLLPLLLLLFLFLNVLFVNEPTGDLESETRLDMLGGVGVGGGGGCDCVELLLGIELWVRETRGFPDEESLRSCDPFRSDLDVNFRFFKPRTLSPDLEGQK